MSELPTYPCRGCGTPFWTYALYCPQCGRKRWSKTLNGVATNHDTRETITGGFPPVAVGPSSAPPPTRTVKAPEAPDLVTLNQAAGIVHRSKRSLERYKTQGKLPDPAVEG